MTKKTLVRTVLVLTPVLACTIGCGEETGNVTAKLSRYNIPRPQGTPLAEAERFEPLE